MQKCKKIIVVLLTMVHGVWSGMFTPYILAMIFNLTDGVCENPEGVMFIPFGILNLLAIVALDVFIIVKTVRSQKRTKVEKMVAVTLFAVAKVAGLLVDINGWKNLLHGLQWLLLKL